MADITEIDREDFRNLLIEIGKTRIPFGKFGIKAYPPAGVPIMDLPPEYLCWFQERGFPKGRLGELMAALGLSTMLSEAVLVRVAIPLLGETRCMRIGLASFSLQCVLLAVADSPWHLFGCAFLAMAGNLVYPSVSSWVSSTVRPDMVGRALGAVNGVKSLTEGIGPLLFGTVRVA